MKADTKELAVIDRAAIALNASAVEKQIHELLEKSKGITVITNAAGRDECHAAAMQTVKARTSISKDGAAARADATAYSKAVIAEEKRLLGLIEPEEARLRTLRDEWDAKIEAEKAAKAQAEAERQERIQVLIDGIRNAPAIGAMCTAAQLAVAILGLQQTDITEEAFAERKDEAVFVMAQTLKQMTAMLEGKRAQEQLAAQQEATRLESERIARELAAQRLAEEKAQREAMAAQAAELARQKAEMDQRAHELAEAEAKVKAAQEAILSAERAKMDEEVRASAFEAAKARSEAEAKLRAELEAAAVDERRKAAQIAAQSKPFNEQKKPNDSTDHVAHDLGFPVPPADRPSRAAIIGCIAAHFGVNEDVALDWILAEFRGDIAFAARKEAA